MSSIFTSRPKRILDQDQFLTILSREEALGALRGCAVPARPCRRRRGRLPDALGCALAEDVVAPIDVPPFDRSNVDGFRGALRRSRARRRGRAGAAGADRRDHRLRHRADAAGALRHRDGDRDRRSGAARRRRHRDGRAHPAGRPGAEPRDRGAPRGVARAVRVLCRLRHRARRGAAARRHHDRLARDRHARGLRHRRGFGGASSAGCDPVDRRRAGAAGTAAAAGRDLRHQRRDRHRGDRRERRRCALPRRDRRRRG